ncbi:CHC2 zinc finger domain-containing protein [Mycoavidus cysteinexigens]|uniref:CHC2 zinc finger domain-containing protein n=1 Tax=Mycoavidus cysteinexigens TaxID=1553431 RepID=UPI000693B19B|nr:CHC2 zinc finger domain-containing protein [Mycoavidus cysteinexigens]
MNRAHAVQRVAPISKLWHHASFAQRSAFRRERLPSPAEYFCAQGLKLFGGGEWKTALCPFHADTKPSLRVRLDSGGFRCMACGAHGGDVLSFHRQRYGLGFAVAAKALGAWESQP